jgi:hypothetical protein
MIPPSLIEVLIWLKYPAAEWAGWLDLGKMNLQLIANEQNQDRAQYGKNEAGGMISFV